MTDYQKTALEVARSGFGGNYWEPLPEGTSDEVVAAIQKDREAFKSLVYHYVKTEVLPELRLNGMSAGEKRVMLLRLLEDPEVELMVFHEGALESIKKSSVCFNGPVVQVSLESEEDEDEELFASCSRSAGRATPLGLLVQVSPGTEEDEGFEDVAGRWLKRVEDVFTEVPPQYKCRSCGFRTRDDGCTAVCPRCEGGMEEV